MKINNRIVSKSITTSLTLLVTMVFLLPEANASLSGRKIGLDPGHGAGVNQGVVIAEGTWVLDAGLRARTHLQNHGAQVVMTRTTGTDVALTTRANILNSNNVNLTISIHSNAASSGAVGMEALWCNQSHSSASLNLANRLRLRSLSMVHNVNRGNKECLDVGRGFHFYIIRGHMTMPASLPEYYFHTNSWENNNIHNTTSGRENVARSLYAGVCDYYGVTPNFGGGGGVTVTVDNHHSGFSASGNWATSTLGTQKLGPDYRWRSTTAISDPATWTGNLPSSGSWRVEARWTAGTNRSTEAPFLIHHSGGTANVKVNQQINGGSWRNLGTYNFAAGNRQVQLSCWAPSGFVVIADGVRWVKQ